MSWLLFMDESGHDHSITPYEVRGGFAVHASQVWPLTQTIRTTEQSIFGAYLHEFGSEIKGAKLLKKDRFKWDRQSPRFDSATRRKHALNFLNNTRQHRKPRRDEFTAFGQASIAFVDSVLKSLKEYNAKVFAAMIPRIKRPAKAPPEYLRKDQVFLLERFFYFLGAQQETGLIVMDGTEKAADRRFVRRMERYFVLTDVGRKRTQWIVPVPLFVESDMAYGVQLADLCIYCLNWGLRLKGMNEPTRQEIEPFAWVLKNLIWHGDGYRGNRVYPTHGVVYVQDPYEGR